MNAGEPVSAHRSVEWLVGRPDLFFAYLKDGMVMPEVIDEIRATGVPTCNFSCNNEHQFHLVEQVSPDFDFSLHSEKSAAEKFDRIGATPLWFPMAANPKDYHPYDVPQTIDVSFVGQCYALRPRHVLRLLMEGIEVQVFGPGWLLDSSREFVDAAESWLCRVLDANASGRLPHDALRRVVMARWLAVCRAAGRHGPWTVARFERSPITCLIGCTVQEKLRLYAVCGVRSAARWGLRSRDLLHQRGVI